VQAIDNTNSQQKLQDKGAPNKKLLKHQLLILMNIRSYNVIVAPRFANIAVERFKAIFSELAKFSVTSDTSAISATNATSATNEVKHRLEILKYMSFDTALLVQREVYSGKERLCEAVVFVS